MLGTYDLRFTLPNGRQVFVPSSSSREEGASIHRALRRRWRRPDYFYHFRSGGHVAALRHHLADEVFAMLDIDGFFDSVTRSKVHRALRTIGYPHEDAWTITRESTVEKTRRMRDFSLPYGFIQSPVLASLALDRSALGRKMKEIARSNRTRLSSYMDDIILSGLDPEPVESSRLALIEAANQSGFTINHVKSQPTGTKVVAFNVVLSHGGLVLTEERLAEFADAVVQADLIAVRAILAYARTVNWQQARYLARVARWSPDAEVREYVASLLGEHQRDIHD